MSLGARHDPPPPAPVPPPAPTAGAAAERGEGALLWRLGGSREGEDAVTPTCPYCGAPSQLTSGVHIYPHRPDLAEKRFYECRPCAAYVGCHPGSTTPLGRLANAELRRWKQRVHAAFDPHWRRAKDPKHARTMAYARLAREMGIPPSECHTGIFDVERCRAALAVIQKWGNP